MRDAVTIDDIIAAHDRISPYIHRTPILSSSHINAEAGTSVMFKCEILQKVGAFKARGALNAVRFRPDAQAIAVAVQDGNVSCYDLKEGKRLWRKRHGGAVLGLSWSPQGNLATAGADGRVVVWKQNGSVAGKSPARGEWLYAVAFGHDGQRLFVGDWAGVLHCLSSDAKKVQATSVPSVAQPSS